MINIVKLTRLLKKSEQLFYLHHDGTHYVGNKYCIYFLDELEPKLKAKLVEIGFDLDDKKVQTYIPSGKNSAVLPGPKMDAFLSICMRDKSRAGTSYDTTKLSYYTNDAHAVICRPVAHSDAKPTALNIDYIAPVADNKTPWLVNAELVRYKDDPTSPVWINNGLSDDDYGIVMPVVCRAVSDWGQAVRDELIGGAE